MINNSVRLQRGRDLPSMPFRFPPKWTPAKSARVLRHVHVKSLRLTIRVSVRVGLQYFIFIWTLPGYLLHHVDRNTVNPVSSRIRRWCWYLVNIFSYFSADCKGNANREQYKHVCSTSLKNAVSWVLYSVIGAGTVGFLYLFWSSSAWQCAGWGEIGRPMLQNRFDLDSIGACTWPHFLHPGSLEGYPILLGFHINRFPIQLTFVRRPFYSHRTLA